MAIAAQYRTQDGRNSAHATYAGQMIEVVTGYDINEDRYPFHVYVTKGGVRYKVDCKSAFESNKDAALDAGLGFAAHWIDANP